MTQIYLINVTGKDNPGLLASFTKTLGEYEANILDISQAVIHERLMLALLIELPNDSEANSFLKDALYKAHNLELQLYFTPISLEQYESWVQSQRDKRYIFTLLGRNITTQHITKIADLIQKNDLNIHFINRLSARKSVFQQQTDTGLTCIEFTLRGTPRNLKKLRSKLLYISQKYEIDIGLQEDTPYRRHRRLIAFDMDSTLIQTEVIDKLAAKAGADSEVSKITESAMRGEIDFKESLRKRVNLLRGLDSSVLEEVASKMPITEGAERLIKNLKTLGYKIAILSGGFTYFGEKLKSYLGIDYLYANELESKDGKLTGQVKGEIIDGQKKAELLQHLAHKENISMEQVIAVGDGANDLPMLDLAGLGIAFRAKPRVREGAEQAISNVGLDAILYFIGLRDREAMA